MNFDPLAAAFSISKLKTVMHFSAGFCHWVLCVYIEELDFSIIKTKNKKGRRFTSTACPPVQASSKLLSTEQKPHVARRLIITDQIFDIQMHIDPQVDSGERRKYTAV